jgi:peptidoglycan glycosyltransferase
MAAKRRLPFSLLLLVFCVGSILAGCSTPFSQTPPAQTPPNPGARGSIYDRNGVLLAYTEANAQATGGYQRRYCVPSLSPIIGYFNPTLGQAGLEAAYNDQLASGKDIYLTIDARVQNMLDAQDDITYDEPGGVFGTPIHRLAKGSVGPASSAISALCKQDDGSLLARPYQQPAETAAHSHPGSVIVEDPHTGEILGMLSRPYYNADLIGDPSRGAAYFQQLSQDPLKPLLARPVSASYVGGAVVDTITLSAALDSGKYQLTIPFGGPNCLAPNSQARSYTVGSTTFRDMNLPDYAIPPACPVDLEHGYIYNDNVIAARVGVGLGAATWLKYAQRFGLSDSANAAALPFDLPAKASTINVQDAQSSQVNLAEDAFGQGSVLVSPLEMAFITSAIANNGIGLLPHLLYKMAAHGADPRHVAPVSPTPYTGNGVSRGQIISPQTAAEVRLAMRGVVQVGSAAIIAGSHANAGGQTGTGELGTGDDPQSWFLSLAPDGSGQTPQYSVVVMRENGDNGLFQAPVADCIYLSLLNQPNVHTGTFYPEYTCAGR